MLFFAEILIPISLVSSSASSSSSSCESLTPKVPKDSKLCDRTFPELKMKESAADGFNGGGSPLMKSYETTPERFSPLFERSSSFQSPSSLDLAPSFKTNKEDTNVGHKKRTGRKSGNFAFRIRDHAELEQWTNETIPPDSAVKMGPNFYETVKGKLRLGARIVKKGGRENIFKQIFGLSEGEELLKASQCYLSTTAGPIAGLLFISTEKVAFCSERSITLSTSAGQLIRTPYKVLIPIRKVRSLNHSENVNKPEQKYIEIVTVDDSEFWFMGFLRYEIAFRNLEKAISMANPL